jgi:hypothetical protein
MASTEFVPPMADHGGGGLGWTVTPTRTRPGRAADELALTVLVVALGINGVIAGG